MNTPIFGSRNDPSHPERSVISTNRKVCTSCRPAIAETNNMLCPSDEGTDDTDIDVDDYKVRASKRSNSESSHSESSDRTGKSKKKKKNAHSLSLDQCPDSHTKHIPTDRLQTFGHSESPKHGEGIVTDASQREHQHTSEERGSNIVASELERQDRIAEAIDRPVAGIAKAPQWGARSVQQQNLGAITENPTVFSNNDLVGDFQNTTRRFPGGLEEALSLQRHEHLALERYVREELLLADEQRLMQVQQLATERRRLAEQMVVQERKLLQAQRLAQERRLQNLPRGVSGSMMASDRLLDTYNASRLQDSYRVTQRSPTLESRIDLGAPTIQQQALMNERAVGQELLRRRQEQQQHLATMRQSQLLRLLASSRSGGHQLQHTNMSDLVGLHTNTNNNIGAAVPVLDSLLPPIGTLAGRAQVPISHHSDIALSGMSRGLPSSSSTQTGQQHAFGAAQHPFLREGYPPSSQQRGRDFEGWQSEQDHHLRLQQQRRRLASIANDPLDLPAPSLSTVVGQLPVVLARPNDSNKLSPHQVFLRNQIEAFQATEDDVTTHIRGRNKPIRSKQVGIRCRHCSHLPVARRQKGSTYFPATLLGLYQAVQNMGTTHLQCGLCKEMPDAYKERFVQLLEAKMSCSGAGRPFWAASARELGLVDTNHGIFLGSDVPEGVEVVDPDTPTGVKASGSTKHTK